MCPASADMQRRTVMLGKRVPICLKEPILTPKTIELNLKFKKPALFSTRACSESFTRNFLKLSENKASLPCLNIISGLETVGRLPIHVMMQYLYPKTLLKSFRLILLMTIDAKILNKIFSNIAVYFKNASQSRRTYPRNTRVL